jgi:hypothetical protein
MDHMLVTLPEATTTVISNPISELMKSTTKILFSKLCLLWENHRSTDRSHTTNIPISRMLRVSISSTN